MTPFKTGTLGAIAAGLALTVSVALPDAADARRGGSFGSRGARTFTAPAATNVAPKTAPVQRSMTDRPAASPNATRAQAGQPATAARPGGMARGLIGGLVAGGLIGALLGGGLGSLGGAGMLMALFQVLLIGGAAFFLFRMFRTFRMARSRPQLAGAHGGAMPSTFAGFEPRPAPEPAARQTSVPRVTPMAPPPSEDIAITDADREDFERLLSEVQDAFGKEDFARLRERTTPEVMSYFAEELSQNATSGRRNSIAGTVLLNAAISEAWAEEDAEYATVAMHYESIDLMLDRATGAVVEGNPDQPSETTELWTFKRGADGEWRLSAIQEA